MLCVQNFWKKNSVLTEFDKHCEPDPIVIIFGVSVEYLRLTVTKSWRRQTRTDKEITWDRQQTGHGMRSESGLLR